MGYMTASDVRRMFRESARSQRLAWYNEPKSWWRRCARRALGRWGSIVREEVEDSDGQVYSFSGWQPWYEEGMLKRVSVIGGISGVIASQLVDRAIAYLGA